jgi:hypothetical protein
MVKVRPNQNKAFVQFNQYQEAQKALKSPEAVLSNRFIKVFWANRQGRDEGSEGKKYEPPPQREFPIPEIATQPKVEKPKLDVQKLQKEKEELRKQQLEHSKALLESLTKMKNIDPKEKSEIMKKINSLTNNVASSLAKDSTTLEKTATKVKNLRAESKKEALDRELEILAKKPKLEDISLESSTPMNTEEPSKETRSEELERLQKRYNSLKNMAANMGIDTSSPVAPRGRGRGRGGIRGRGAPRGRGRGG